VMCDPWPEHTYIVEQGSTAGAPTSSQQTTPNFCRPGPGTHRVAPAWPVMWAWTEANVNLASMVTPMQSTRDIQVTSRWCGGHRQCVASSRRSAQAGGLFSLCLRGTAAHGDMARRSC